MAATVTSKGQVTIPKSVRDLLGIKPGNTVDFQRAPDGRGVLVKCWWEAAADPFRAPARSRRQGAQHRRYHGIDAGRELI